MKIPNIFRNKLIKAGASYTIANVVLRGISFLTLPIFVRLLTTTEFGRYNVFVSFESIIGMFSALTLHASIKNAKYDMANEYDAYVKNCIYFDFYNSILLAFIANIICLFYSDIIDLTFLEVNLLVLSGFCGAVISIYSSKLIMDYLSKDYVIVSMITSIFGVVLSLIYIYSIFSFDHYLGRLIGGICGQVIATLYIFYKLFKDKSVKVNLNYWKYGLKISLPIVPHGLSQIILGSSDRIMIKYMYTEALAGIYSLTYTVSLIPSLIFNSIANVWEPWFFENMNEGKLEAIKKTSTKLCLLMTLGFIGFACVTPEMVKIIATKDYYDAIDVSILVIAGVYFASLYNIPCEVEYFYKKTKFIAIGSVFAASVNVLLNYIFMHYYSYKIAAVTTLITYFLYFLFHMFISYRIQHKWFFDVNRMMSLIGVGCVTFGVIYISIDNFFVRYAILTVSIVCFVLQFRGLHLSRQS